MSHRKLTLIGAAFLALAAYGFIGCSAMPVLRGDLDEVTQDQAAAMESAESGNTWRTAISSLSALVGAVLVSMGQIKRKDNQNFSGTVNGRKVEASEDELVALVEAKRAAPGADKN